MIEDSITKLRKTIVSAPQEKTLVRFIVKLLSTSPFGRIVFRLNCILKKFLLYLGYQDQRAIEYPWVLKQLASVKQNSLVLDIGCAESLLSQELIARKYNVVGIDLADYPFKNKRMTFIRGNILNTPLSSNKFDAIICISTIEHIGLPSHGQEVLNDLGDINAMNEFHRILKPRGILILTTPYVGKESIEHRTAGVYNRDRLDNLTGNFYYNVEDYFYTIRSGKRWIWTKMNRQQIDEQRFNWKQSFFNWGLACFILTKGNKVLRGDVNEV